ncbi:MAG: hypothetical protein ACTHOH_00415 [Lysobacteraceae bacterium]
MAAPAGRLNLARLNLALILGSALLAVRWPFETLLLAYAVLGPLHYLTEISWLHDRRYFLPRRHDVWPLLLGGTALILAVATIAASRKTPLRLAIEHGALFALFGFALVMVLTPRWRTRLLALLMLVPACALLARMDGFATSLAGYLPTVLHVYVFTGLFMLAGTLRRPSRDGRAALAAYALCPLLCWWAPLAWSAPASGWAGQAFIGTLSSISRLILGDAGHALGGTALLTDPVAVLVARVLALAYLYHYLNWFSKVEVIGWARMSPLRATLIGAAWIGASALYFRDYLLGFTVLLLLSFLHVVLEFPLNHRTFRELGERLAGGGASRSAG